MKKKIIIEYSSNNPNIVQIHSIEVEGQPLEKVSIIEVFGVLGIAKHYVLNEERKKKN